MSAILFTVYNGGKCYTNIKLNNLMNNSLIKLQICSFLALLAFSQKKKKFPTLFPPLLLPHTLSLSPPLSLSTVVCHHGCSYRHCSRHCGRFCRLSPWKQSLPPLFASKCSLSRCRSLSLNGWHQSFLSSF